MSLPTYRQYKDTAVEWLGEVPSHWEVLSIKRLSPVQRGASPRPIDDPKYFDDEGEYAWVRIADVSASNGVLTETTQRLSEIGANLSVKLHPGDLFVSIAGTVGKPCIAAIKACIHDGFVYFPNLNVPPHFLFRIFEAGLCYSGLGKWGTQLNLNTDTIGSIKIALPPGDELSSILDFLDRETSKIDALIAEQEKLLILLAEKRQATISHAVTRGLNPDAPMKDSGVAWLGEVPAHWEVSKVGYDCNVLSGFAFPSAGFSLDDADVSLLRGVNVGVGTLRWNEVVYWNRVADDELDAYELRPGDIVLGMDRPWISEGLRVARVSENDTPCLLLQRVATIRPNTKLDADYLYYLFRAGYFFHHCAPEMTGVSVPHISPEQIRSFVVPVPPVNEQSDIVAFVEAECMKLDALDVEGRRSIDLLKERRSALIAAAVTGKIDVRNAVPEELAA
ncbi:restriction endonuclease subunit S [Burkholderia sp. MSMB1589WGS]|uniref:restriction endonuclease subunit S n=1 Tax=Burkholderia sp. MSMB1589WGS TaxID=1636425 RepID=UPI0009ECE42E|nr:restriction endonuclease subunit S [Burkholderia sp. MSMB1589WGS]